MEKLILFLTMMADEDTCQKWYVPLKKYCQQQWSRIVFAEVGTRYLKNNYDIGTDALLKKSGDDTDNGTLFRK